MARANDGSVASLKDIADKKVSVITLGGIADLGLRVMLAKAGVSYKSLQVLEVPYPQITPALAQGRIDLGAQVEPFSSLMQMKKAGKVIKRGIFGGELGPRYLVAGWFAKKAWIAKNTAAARAFTRAITGAVKHLNAHPNEAPALIAANTRLTEQLANRIVRSAHEPTIRTADLQPIIDAAAKHRIIDKSFAASEIVPNIAPRR